MSSFKEDDALFERVADQVVALGNQFLDQDAEADPWEIASGLLAGAIHYWLYTRQPCGEPGCEECAELDTAEKRLRLLLAETRRAAEESDYFHSPNDSNVGRA